MPTLHKRPSSFMTIPEPNEPVQPVHKSVKEQGKQSLFTALTEIEELKLSLRHCELTLIKCRQENEKLQGQLKEQDKQIDVSF